MSSRRVLYGLLTVGLWLVVVVFGGTQPIRATWTSISIAPVCPGAPQISQDIPANETLGIPAITPRNNCTPSFTVQDAYNYVTKHPVLIQTPGSDKPTVTSIEFMTVHAASVLMGNENTGLDDKAIVCYVVMSGSFEPYSAPLLGNAPNSGTNYSYFTGIVIFDAHDGNILVSS